MKRTLKNSALLAATIIAVTGTAYACTNNNDCSGGQVCAPGSMDYRQNAPKTCQERQSIFASWGRALVNAVTNIITPIAPVTIPITRTTATVVAPNATNAADAIARLMERMRPATPALIQYDENGDAYTCEPEEPSGSGNAGGGMCYMPQEEKDKCTGNFQQIQDCYMRYYDENCEGA